MVNVGQRALVNEVSAGCEHATFLYAQTIEF
jgi:hypothetical protein